MSGHGPGVLQSRSLISFNVYFGSLVTPIPEKRSKSQFCSVFQKLKIPVFCPLHFWKDRVLGWRPFTGFLLDLCAILQSCTITSCACQVCLLRVFACHTWLDSAATALLSGTSIFMKDWPYAGWACLHGLRHFLGALPPARCSGCLQGARQRESSILCDHSPSASYFFCGQKLPTAFLESFWCQHWFICYVVPDFTAVAQSCLLCGHILGRRIEKKSLLGFVCFWYLDISLSQLVKSIKAC